MHNICYEVFDEKVSEDRINAEVLHIVRNSGDGYGTDYVSFSSRPPFVNKKAAEEYIKSVDGQYKGIAVRYYDYSKCKETKKIETLKQRIAENQAKKREYIKAHSVRAFKAEYVGCSCCGSKLKKELLRSERCPVCYEDLRAKSTLDRIQCFDKKEKELLAQIDAEKQKDKKNASVKWLVKYEYHS
jgi:transposase